MRQVFAWTIGAVGFLGFLFFLACAGMGIPLEFVFYMLGGWVLYLWRTIDHVTINWPDILLALSALTLLVAGLHAFFRWLYSTTRRAESDSFDVWKIRWTLSTVSILILMFIAGIGAIGVVHQLVWMASSPDPMITKSRIAAGRNESLSNLREHGKGIGNYGRLPPGATSDQNGQLLHGWQAVLLPYIGEGRLSDRINYDVAWNHPENTDALQTRVGPYVSDWQWRDGEPVKDSEGYALTDYSSNAHVIGGTRALRPNEITDGKATTIVTGEAFTNRKPWGYPANWRDPSDGLNTSPSGFNSTWPGVVQFSFADGHVKAIHEGIDPRVLRALATPNGGEEIDDPEF